MCFVCSFIPASIFTTIGYFVLLTAHTQRVVISAYGATRLSALGMFGTIVAIALFVVAAGLVLGGAYMTATGKCPMKRWMERMA